MLGTSTYIGNSLLKLLILLCFSHLWSHKNSLYTQNYAMIPSDFPLCWESNSFHSSLICNPHPQPLSVSLLPSGLFTPPKHQKFPFCSHVQISPYPQGPYHCSTSWNALLSVTSSCLDLCCALCLCTLALIESQILVLWCDLKHWSYNSAPPCLITVSCT